MTTPKCCTCGGYGEVIDHYEHDTGAYIWVPCPDCYPRPIEPPPPTETEIEQLWAEMLGQENPR